MPSSTGQGGKHRPPPPALQLHGEQSPGQSMYEAPVPWRGSPGAPPSDSLSTLRSCGHTAAVLWAGPPSNLNWVSSWFWRKFIQFTGLKRLLYPRGQADGRKAVGMANIIERRGKRGIPRRPGGMSPGDAKRADDNCQMSFITRLCLYLLPTSLNNCPLGPKLSLFSLSPKVSWQEVWAKLFRASGSYAHRQWNDIVSAFKINKRVFGHRELSNENSEMAEPLDVRSPTSLVSKQLSETWEKMVCIKKPLEFEGSRGGRQILLATWNFFHLDCIITSGWKPLLLFIYSSAQPPKRTKFPLRGLQFLIIFHSVIVWFQTDKVLCFSFWSPSSHK